MFSEHDIDRELKAALSVSPSAGFEARVLQRVEEDRPASWAARYGWLAAAASLVLAAGVFYALNRTVPAPTPQIVERTATPAALPQPDIPAPAPGPAPVSETPRVAVVRFAARAPRHADPEDRPEPEVIVSVNQMEAVRRLVRAVNEGRLEAPAEPPAEPPQGPLAAPATVSIAPVVVKPIPLSPLSPGKEGK